MSEEPTAGRLTRRTFLKAGGVAAAAVGAGAVLAGIPLGGGLTRRAEAVTGPPVRQRLAASDGFISLPGVTDIPHVDSRGLYVFGFVEIPLTATQSQATTLAKGKVDFPAPILSVDEDRELQLQLTNVGFVARPDLTDGHTIHWHGFRNAIALFDGVPEVSISVPAGRTFPYVYRPHDAGTFMYHCHFEDVEHVQLGMQGVIFVRPLQNGTPIGGFTKFAYNDGDGSTGYRREFTLLLDEIWVDAHVRSLFIQEEIWTNYDPDYWTINGRAYPDTIKPMGSQLPAGDPLKPRQRISSLIQVDEGERTLLRFVNLGYQQQSMQLQGIPMKVVGEDAALLRGPGGADLSYTTNEVYIGPGESRDALFTAPAFVGPGETDPAILPGSPFNRYRLQNRDLYKLTNNGSQTPDGLGGQVTEVRVYPAGTLPPPTDPNRTYV